MEISSSLFQSNKAFYQDSNPRFFDLNQESDKVQFNQLLNNKKPQVFDEFEIQLRDLIKNQNPSKKLSDDEMDALLAEKIGESNLLLAGCWVYYPWNNRLVHILKEDDFVELRTVRNKFKITQEEQDLLATKKIGVVGLSVGQSVSLSLSMERSYGELKLADFDTLELSNYNRIRTPLTNLGLLKTTTVKREILEIDPYLNVKTYDKGLEEGKIEDFIKDLDIVVDEFDDFYLKIKVRTIARKLKIPVISEMSDQGMVDIERFDLESDREIYHGRITDEDIEQVYKVDLPVLIEKLIPYDSISSRMQASYLEIGKKLTTWPQLGADVAYGGGLCAILIRKILLKEKVFSGRYYFDLDKNI